MFSRVERGNHNSAIKLKRSGKKDCVHSVLQEYAGQSKWAFPRLNYQQAVAYCYIQSQMISEDFWSFLQ